MPKLKKNPPTPFGIYLRKRRRSLEAQGYVFMSGNKDILEVCHQEWKNLTKEEQEVYKQMAKEEKEERKHDLTQKFTSTGESFAELQRRQEANKKAHEELERLVDNLTLNSNIPQAERNFIVIKTIHSCIDHNVQSYWPAELAVAVFNLRDGLKCQYWTLVNTKQSPPGYAVDVKDTCEETALPRPSTSSEAKGFLPMHTEYKRIIGSIRRFIEEFLESYPRDFVLFTISEKEVKSAEGCLQWLYDNAKESMSENEIPGWEYFFDHLRFYPLPRLVLRFAFIAKSITPEYENAMAKFPDLQQAAEALLNQTTFNYRSDISCNHHALEENCHKIDHCCQNIVLRSIYLIVDHFVKPFKLTRLNGHNIEKFAERSSSARARAAKGTTGASNPSSFKTNTKDSELDSVWTAVKSGRHPNRNAAAPLAITPAHAKSMMVPESQSHPNDSFDDTPAPSAGFTIRAPAQSAPSAPRLPPLVSPGQGRGVAVSIFQDDDFPPIGAARSGPGLPHTWGAGVGRGRGRGRSGGGR